MNAKRPVEHIIGFDTASTVALLSISALAKSSGNEAAITPSNTLIFAVSCSFHVSLPRLSDDRFATQFIFTSGMTLVDSLDSILMLYSYTDFAERSLSIFRRRTLEAGTTEAGPLASELPQVTRADELSPGVEEKKDPVVTEQPALTGAVPGEDHAGTPINVRVKQRTMSGLSVALTVMSILLAFRCVAGEPCVRSQAKSTSL
jgi:high-affinity nickel-transport protein